MRIAYADCFAGAAGDMFLGAIVDAGLPLADLAGDIACIRAGDWRLDAERVMRGAISATKIHVRVTTMESGGQRLADLREAVAGHRLAARMVEVFTRLCEAEALAHGTSPEEVHLHEAGAIDAIVDVAGTVAGLDLLGVTRLVSAPVPTGRGRVTTAHGDIPVPGPAVVELLRGVPSYGGDIDGEATTPTGAALLTTLAHSFGTQPRMTVERVGYGAGDADRPLANCLRLLVGEAVDQALPETVAVIEFAVDDMPAQWIAAMAERLFALGALDVYTTAVGMKKGRPGTLITVTSEPGRAPELVDAIFRESTTLGVRKRLEGREVLARRHEAVETPYGIVRIKVGSREGKDLNAQPEFEDVAQAAARTGVAIKEVHAAAVSAWVK